MVLKVKCRIYFAPNQFSVSLVSFLTDKALFCFFYLPKIISYVELYSFWSFSKTRFEIVRIITSTQVLCFETVSNFIDLSAQCVRVAVSESNTITIRVNSFVVVEFDRLNLFIIELK